MKDKKQHSLGRNNYSLMFALALLMTGGLLASCTQDEFAGGSLLEERTLLEPTATNLYESVATPAGIGTRGTVDGDWNGAVYSTVAVRVKDEENEVKEYTISEVSGNSAHLTCNGIADDETNFWWTKKDETKIVDAWYPYRDDFSATIWTVHEEQSLGTMAKDDFMYAFPVNMKRDNQELVFRHMLAKIEINLHKSPYLSNANKVEVFLDGMYKEGKITITNRPYLWGDGEVCTITPRLVKLGGDNYASYEALVMPIMQFNFRDAYLRVMVDGATYRYQLNEACIDFTSGYRYTYNVTVKEKGLDVKAESSMEWGKDGASGEGSVTLPTVIDLSQVNGDIVIGYGTYFLKGNGQEINYPIIVNDDADITFENEVKIKAETAMKINGGCKVKLNVKGKGHSLVSTYDGNGNDGAGIQIGDNSGIEIIGDSKETSALSVTGSDGSAGIGPPMSQSIHCRGIIIRDIDLIVNSTSGNYGHSGSAIGLGFVGGGETNKQELDKIEIINSHITATSESGACIGMGYIWDETTYIGEITISGSVLSLTAKEVFVTAGSYQIYCQGACIGFGSNGEYKDGMRASIGSINISNTVFDNCKGYRVIGNGMVFNQDHTEKVPTLGKFTHGITIGGMTYQDWWNSKDDNGGYFK